MPRVGSSPWSHRSCLVSLLTAMLTGTLGCATSEPTGTTRSMSRPTDGQASSARAPDTSAPLLPSDEKALAEGIARQLGQNQARPDEQTTKLLFRLQQVYGTPLSGSVPARALAWSVYSAQVRRIVETHRPDMAPRLHEALGPLPPPPPMGAEAAVYAKNALAAYAASPGPAERTAVEITLGHYEGTTLNAAERARRWCPVRQQQALHNLTQVEAAQQARRQRGAAYGDLKTLGLSAINRAGAYDYRVDTTHGGFIGEARGRPGTEVAGDLWRVTATSSIGNVNNVCADALTDAQVAERIDHAIVQDLKTLGDPQAADDALLLYRCHVRQDIARSMLRDVERAVKTYRAQHSNDWPSTADMHDLLTRVKAASDTTLYRLEHWDAGRPTEHWRAVGKPAAAMAHDEWMLNKIGKLKNNRNVCGTPRSE